MVSGHWNPWLTILATGTLTYWPQTGLIYLDHQFQEHRLALETLA